MSAGSLQSIVITRLCREPTPRPNDGNRARRTSAVQRLRSLAGTNWRGSERRLPNYCVEKVAFLDFRQISGVPFALPGQRSSIVERSEWSQYAYDIAQILEATFSTQYNSTRRSNLWLMIRTVGGTGGRHSLFDSCRNCSSPKDRRQSRHRLGNLNSQTGDPARQESLTSWLTSAPRTGT